MKLYLSLLPLLFFLGCSSKTVTISSLQPSQIDGKKINKVIIENFLNDEINQTNYLEEKLSNKIVEGKRVFTIQPTYENIDAIITGEVLKSTINYYFYYDEETDYSRCARFAYENGKRTNECEEYYEIRIPCERKDFRVETKIKVLNKNEKILFSKIYSGSRHFDECYRYRIFFPRPYFHNKVLESKEKYRINSLIAKELAAKMVNDISPHYFYEEIDLIKNLKGKNYKNEDKKEFELIVNLLDENKIDLAQKRLLLLDTKLNFSSYEVMYNLGLTYEAQDSLSKAKEFYENAKSICKDVDDLTLIEKAITRIEINLVNKIKAKSQLP